MSRIPATAQIHAALGRHDCLCGITNAQIVALTGLPADGVRRSVERLRAQQLITPVGSRRQHSGGIAALAWRLTVCAGK